MKLTILTLAFLTSFPLFVGIAAYYFTNSLIGELTHA